jgi:hypothetical protein
MGRGRAAVRGKEKNKLFFPLTVTVVGNFSNSTNLGVGGAPLRYSTKSMNLRSAPSFFKQIHGEAA